MRTASYILSGLLIVAIVAISGCEPNEGIKSNPRYRFGVVSDRTPDALFTDMPLLFFLDVDDVVEMSEETHFKIVFGDGGSQDSGPLSKTWNDGNNHEKTFSMSRFEHKYEQPGTYHIELRDMDEVLLDDTTVFIHKAPKNVLAKEGLNRPWFIWKDNASNYYIVHTFGFQLSDWVVSKFNSSFDLLNAGSVANDQGTQLTNFSTNAAGNVYVANDYRLEEYNQAGQLVLSKELKYNSIRSIYNTGDNILMAIDSTYGASQYMVLAKFDKQGKFIESKHVSNFNHGVFAKTGELMALTGWFSESSEFIIMGPDGTTKVQKPFVPNIFPVGTMNRKAVPVDGGFIFVNSDGTNITNIARIDLQGNKVWQVPWTMRMDAAIDAVSINGETYVFYDNFQAARIDATGHVVWNKYIATTSDFFGAVTYNNAGNFTVAGWRYCPLYVDICKNANLVLMEVDKAGNIIDH